MSGLAGIRGPIGMHTEDQSHPSINPRVEIHGLGTKVNLRVDISSKKHRSHTD